MVRTWSEHKRLVTDEILWFAGSEMVLSLRTD
jgi:hypothetical protein